jgi:hypothetical protein
MKGLVRAGLLTLFFCVLLPHGASACDCGDPGPPCKAFANTPVVFAGRVVKIATISVKAPSGDFYEDRLVFLEVERSYRGSVGKTAEVVTGSVSMECAYDFRMGEHYLVYAYPHPQSGKLYTGICQRTRVISEAGDDLDYLSKKDVPSHGAGIEEQLKSSPEIRATKLEWSDLWKGLVSWSKASQVTGPRFRRRMEGFDCGGFSQAVIGSLLLCPSVFFPQRKL